MRARGLGWLAASTILLVVGCGGSAPGTTAGATAASPAPAASTVPVSAQPSSTTSAAAPGGATGGLPEACAAEVRAFLVAIEPLVTGVDFFTMTPSAFEQFSQALEGPSSAFDPDACPDLDQATTYAAYLAIAEDVAPGTYGYIDYVYSRP
jgi:hypothetical protein